MIIPFAIEYPEATNRQVRSYFVTYLHAWHPGSQVKTSPLGSNATLEPPPLRMHVLFKYVYGGLHI
jgi:hypothetical protein